MKLLSPNDLVILVAFARNHHRVPFVSILNRKIYRFNSVLNQDGFLALFDSRRNLFENLSRVFGARIIAGNNREIRLLAGDLSHDRSFCEVTITATAKHRDQARGIQFAERPQHVAEGIVGMRVIDKNLKIPP